MKHLWMFRIRPFEKPFDRDEYWAVKGGDSLPAARLIGIYESKKEALKEFPKAQEAKGKNAHKGPSS